MSMNSQLDSNTQTLNRAQQDKAYTESLLAQQLAAWKTSGSSNSPQTMEQQLNNLQAQLMQLQARYTNDHPDVIKTKADIVEVKKRLTKRTMLRTPRRTLPRRRMRPNRQRFRQLRLQVHSVRRCDRAGLRDQKRLQSQIQLYQARTAMSPTIEEQYKVLTRDYDNAQNCTETT